MISPHQPGVAWCGVVLMLAVGAALGDHVPNDRLDWQPLLVWVEPWRAWTAVFVHYSAAHFLANIAGLLLVTGLGVASRVPLRVAVAWCAAWPLTQLGLLSQPELLHYGGLSGVLHAGVAVVAVYMLCTPPRAQRRLAIAILAGLLLKVLTEAPWGPPLRYAVDWDIGLAPLSHACGLVAGVLCGTISEGLSRMRRSS